MMTRLLLLPALLGACTGSPPPPGPGAANAQTDPAYVTAVDRWHQERVKSLQKPTGWLSLVGLDWLDEDRNYTIGGEPGDDVTLPRAPADVGVLRKLGDVVQIEPASGATIKVDGTTIAASTDLRTDAHDKGASEVTVGEVTFTIIDRAGRLGVRVRDPNAATRTAFTGVPRFKVDEAWKVTAQLERHSTPTHLAIPTVLGTTLDEPTPGVLQFEVAGQSVELHPVGDEEGLFLVFGDASNGLPPEEGGTYGGGRFLSVDWDGKADTVVLDFNKAINPPCAFTEFATCPLPPAKNKVAIAIAAGEKAMPGAPGH